MLWHNLLLLLLFLQFKEKEGAVSFASSTSALMQDYEAESVLSGPYSSRYDPEAIRQYLSYLTPQRLQLTMVSKHLEAEAEKNPNDWQQEKWYGTVHRITPLTPAQMASWGNPTTIDRSLHLARPNAFIPTDFTLRCDLEAPPADSNTISSSSTSRRSSSSPSKVGAKAEVGTMTLSPTATASPVCLEGDDDEEEDAIFARPPRLIMSEAPGSHVRVYHKMDRKFRVPKANLMVHLLTGQVRVGDVNVIASR